MSLIQVLALQAAAVATPAAPVPPPARQPWAMADHILREFGAGGSPLDGTAAGSCLAAGAADVLVCGPRHGRGDYPLDRWARIFGPERPIRAEMGLGGNVTGRIYTDAVPMDRGLVSNRVMLGIKLPF